MHGIVMKITKDRIVILCEDGSFRNVAADRLTVSLGERIEVPVPHIAAVPDKPQSRVAALKRMLASFSPVMILKGLLAGGTTPLRRGMLGAAAAAVFMLVIGIGFIVQPTGVSAQPVAMVAVDINPSIELYVNADGKVDQAALINDDAKWLISEDELKDEDLYSALQKIIKKAEEQGYLNSQTEKTFVMLSVVNLDDSTFQVDTQKIALPSEAYSVELYYVDQQEREKAQETGLTVNKYVVLEQAKEMGVELNTDELKGHSVVKALSSSGISPKEFFNTLKANGKYKNKENTNDAQTPLLNEKTNNGKQKDDKDTAKENENGQGKNEDKQGGKTETNVEKQNEKNEKNEKQEDKSNVKKNEEKNNGKQEDRKGKAKKSENDRGKYQDRSTKDHDDDYDDDHDDDRKGEREDSEHGDD